MKSSPSQLQVEVEVAVEVVVEVVVGIEESEQSHRQVSELMNWF